MCVCVCGTHQLLWYVVHCVLQVQAPGGHVIDVVCVRRCTHALHVFAITLLYPTYEGRKYTLPPDQFKNQ